MLRKAVLDKISDLLLTKSGKKHVLHDFTPVPGGSINETYRINTDKGAFFIKLNDAKKYPGMFEAEEKGLNLLRERSSFMVPEVHAVDCIKEDAFILMEHMEKGISNEDFFRSFGKMLSEMHRQSDKGFGLDHDNYIGSLPQSNRPHTGWIEFFVEERMEKQLKRAIDAKAMGKDIRRSFDKLYRRLPDLMPVEPPSLLHGDLWSGNYLASPEGPCLIDPAVYYGHRETDIAMSKLFGGFPLSFYESYQEHYPMEKGWKKRVEVFQLYPLMVHVNLFGGSYVEDVRRIVERF